MSGLVLAALVASALSKVKLPDSGAGPPGAVYTLSLLIQQFFLMAKPTLPSQSATEF